MCVPTFSLPNERVQIFLFLLIRREIDWIHLQMSIILFPGIVFTFEITAFLEIHQFVVISAASGGLAAQLGIIGSIMFPRIGQTLNFSSFQAR